MDNVQQFALEILWKQKEPIELWATLPEDIILQIFRLVDRNFQPPNVCNLTYKKLENVKYENKIDKRKTIVFHLSLGELLQQRSENVVVNTDTMRETEKEDTKIPYENFMEMFDLVMQYRNKN